VCAAIAVLGLLPLMPRPVAGMGLGTVGVADVAPQVGPAVCLTPAIASVQAQKSPGSPDPVGNQAGVTGTMVHINGTNLMATGCLPTIKVNTTTQSAPSPTSQDPTPPVASATDLYFVSSGDSGRVTVTLSDLTGGQYGSNNNLTFIVPPAVTGLSSQSVVERSQVTVSGSGFSLGGLLGGAAVTYYKGSAPTAGSTAVACDEQSVTDTSLSDTAVNMTAPATYCAGQAIIAFVDRKSVV